PRGQNVKGGETLLSAWRAREEDLRRAGASLLVGGPGATERRIGRWRATLRYPEAVIACGPIAPDDVGGHIRASDAVVLPSLQEGLPNVAMEAAACGRAVLGSNVGGVGEVVAHDSTGFLTPPGDVEAWGAVL